MNRLQAPRPPKYWQLVEKFRDDINRGVLKPGDRLPSLAEMKAQQGISRPTMEKVHQILEADGLIQRQPGAGTFVLAPGKRATTGLIGVTGWGFRFGAQSAYWANLMGGIREAASRAGVQVLLLDHNSCNGWEKADGILLVDWSADETLRHVPDELPCVSLLVPVEGMASVAVDDYAAVKTATKYLLAHGHRQIAYLHGTDCTTVPHRLRGYRDALKEAAVEPNANWCRDFSDGIDFGNQFIEAGKQAMQQWIETDWSALGCTALLCHNDEIAVGAMQALSEAAVLVPHDVSVVGFDGTEIGAYVSPRLTTVEVPLREIGACAVEMLLSQIAADKVSIVHRECAVRLRERDSVATRK